MDGLLQVLGDDGQIGIVTLGARLLLAVLFGGLLGWEREARDRTAGLRTHILVCVASAAFALIAVELMSLYANTDGPTRLDPIRLVEAITTGVAFLAAGSIIFNDNKVRGVTTGAGMWLASAIGLATGLGLWRIAVLACVIGGIVLWLLRGLETRIGSKDPPADSS